MSSAYDDVLHAALSLPDAQRAELIDSLIATMAADEGGPVDAAWLTEIERRSAEIDAGAVELVPWDEVRRRVLRETLQRDD